MGCFRGSEREREREEKERERERERERIGLRKAYYLPIFTLSYLLCIKRAWPIQKWLIV